VIHVSHLTKYYGDYPAVRDVSFDVRKGQIVGFLGPNGAGKSTTMRVLAGFLTATSGKATINGFDVFWQPVERAAASATCRRTVHCTPKCASASISPFGPESRGCTAARPANASST
jgi:ABC-type uncharacterized transport system ATPase subunit